MYYLKNLCYPLTCYPAKLNTLLTLSCLDFRLALRFKQTSHSPEGAVGAVSQYGVMEESPLI